MPDLTAPASPAPIVLRSYQAAADREIRRALASGVRRVLTVAPTGAGKTILATSIIQGAVAKRTRTWFLAHRRELIDQPSRKLDQLGVPHGVIQGGHWRNMPWLPVQVASVQTLVNRLDRVEPPGLIIVDECFPAGTPVDGRPIETIRVGDTVSSFDHRTGTVERRKVLHVFRSKPASLVTVHYEGGRITCTGNHPVWNGRAYVEARELKPGDAVARLEKVPHSEDLRCVREDVHPSVMEQQDDPDLLGAVQEGQAGCETQGGDNALRRVRHGRGTQGAKRAEAGTQQAGVLLGGMQGALGENQLCDRHGEDESPLGFTAHAHPQPDEACRRSSEGQREPSGHGMEASSDRGQRPWPDEAATRHVDGVGLADGGCHPDRNAEGRRLPDMLPRGRRQCGSQDRSRGGRQQPLGTETQGRGSEEGRPLALARVDRIEVHQPDGADGFGRLCPGGVVYNLEVEDNHNYFANGLLVHNCHHARATTYERILAKFPDVPVIGLTATPWRTDGKGLGDLFQRSVLVATPAQLVEEGWLARVTGFAFDAPDLRAVRKTGGDYNERELGVVMSETKLAGHVINEWHKHCRPLVPCAPARACLDGRGVRTVVFAVHVEHSKQTAADFCASGVAAEHIDGSMPVAERIAVLQRFASGETRVLVNCNVLTEGFDEPAIGAVILLRPTLSLALAIQMIGRGRRPVCYACGHAASPLSASCERCGSRLVKHKLRLHDHAGVVLQHGLPDDERDWSLTGSSESKRGGGGEKAEAVRVCRKCFALYPPALEACPACGCRNPKRVREIKEVEGEAIPLEEIKRPVQASDERKREEFQRLVRIGKAKGYKDGWAKMRFKGRYGEWPRREWEAMGEGRAA